MTKIVAAFVFFVVCSTLCGAVSDDKESLHQEIKSRLHAFIDAFNQGEAKAAAEVYAVDAHFMPGGKKPMKGRTAIENYYRNDRAEGVANVRMSVEEVGGSGELAFSRGEYRLNGTLGVEEGAYLLVWKKVDGVWQIYSDCFNIIHPAPKKIVGQAGKEKREIDKREID